MKDTKYVDKPLISVIVPSYNHYRYLEKRWKSIIGQTYGNFEIILLDDASTDSSSTLLNDFALHPKVSVLEINRKNSGSVFKQWVKGISYAKGDFIWIAESDDYSDLSFIETTLAVLFENPNAAVVFTDSFIVDEDNEIFHKYSDYYPTLQKIDTDIYKLNPTHKKYFNWYLHNLIICNVSSVLFRTRMLRSLDLEFLSSFKNAGDMYTYLTLSLSHDILFKNEPLNYFRIHAKNETKKNTETAQLHRDRLILVNRLSARLSSKPNGKKQLLFLLRRHAITMIENRHFDVLKDSMRNFKKLNIISSHDYRILALGIMTFKLKGKLPSRYKKMVKSRLKIRIEQLSE